MILSHCHYIQSKCLYSVLKTSNRSTSPSLYEQERECFPLSDVTNLATSSKSNPYIGKKKKSFKHVPESCRNLFGDDLNILQDETNYEEAGENGI